MGLTPDADPGSRAVPVALAVVVAMGGIVELLRATLFLRRHADTASDHQHPPATIAPGRPNYANVGGLATAVLVYLVALSWLGFQVSTVLFCLVVLMRLGARWWSALLAGLAIVIVVRMLFVGLFHVQLPAGAFGLAW